MATPTNRVLRRLNFIDASEPEVSFVSAPELSPASVERLNRAAQERRRPHGRTRKDNKKHDNRKPKKNKTHGNPLPRWVRGSALWRRLNSKKNRARGRGSRGGTVSVHPYYANRG